MFGATVQLPLPLMLEDPQPLRLGKCALGLSIIALRRLLISYELKFLLR